MRPTKRQQQLKQQKSDRVISDTNSNLSELPIRKFEETSNNPYLQSFLPVMLSPKGYVKVKQDKATGEAYQVIYDRNYILSKLDYLIEPLLHALPNETTQIIEELLSSCQRYLDYQNELTQAEMRYQQSLGNSNNEIELTTEQ